MAELQLLLNHCKFFMKCIFCTKFLHTADFSMQHYAGFSQIGSHINALSPGIALKYSNICLKWWLYN